jgi:hypothetical protein
MRLILRLMIVLLVLVVAFVGAIFAASEYGGEVVTLRTQNGGVRGNTHLWVVDDAGFAWLRAGQPTSGWLARIDANPEVVVERGGVATHFHAVPVRDPVVRDRIHALMRAKYPWADRFISVMRNPNGSVPVRLEPVQPSE